MLINDNVVAYVKNDCKETSSELQQRVCKPRKKIDLNECKKKVPKSTPITSWYKASQGSPHEGKDAQEQGSRRQVSWREVWRPCSYLHAPRRVEAEEDPAPRTVAEGLTGPEIPQGQVVPKFQEQFATTSRGESVEVWKVY